MKSIKKKYVIPLIILFLSSIWIYYRVSDCSEILKADNGYVYQIFQVPVTKKLAKSFYNCSYYKRSYKEGLFFRFWNSQMDRKDTLQIEPGQKGTCIVTHKVSAYSNQAEQEMRVVIPQGLSSKVGEYLLLSFNPSPSDKEKISKFSACMFTSDSDPAWHSYWQDFILKDQSSSFDIKKFLDNTQEYIAKWDEKNLKKSKKIPSKCW